MIPILPLLGSAALLGVLHMSAPDHWVTLCFLGKAAGWSRPKLLTVSVITACGHTLLSVALGFAVAALGLVFTQVVASYVTIAIGVIMILAGSFFGLRAALSHPQEDYRVEAESDMARFEGRMGKGLSYFAVLGAALSPDLSALPILLLAAQEGLGVTLETAVVFAVVSILALVILVAAGSVGLSRIFERITPKYNDALVGFVIAAVGVYVVFAG